VRLIVRIAVRSTVMRVIIFISFQVITIAPPGGHGP
jgi:hypothetical protein